MTQLEHARRSARAIRLGQRARIAERGGLRFRAVVLRLACRLARWHASRSWRALNCRCHGLPVSTGADLAAYEGRPECVARGECTCRECSRVCWHRGAEPPSVVVRRWPSTAASERVTTRGHEVDYGGEFGLRWVRVHEDRAFGPGCPSCVAFLAVAERMGAAC